MLGKEHHAIQKPFSYGPGYLKDTTSDSSRLHKSDNESQIQSKVQGCHFRSTHSHYKNHSSRESQKEKMDTHIVS